MIVFLKILAGGIIALVLGALPWAVPDAMAAPGEGASFAMLFWFIIGPPICFILMPLGYFATRTWPLAAWTVVPLILSVGYLSVFSPNGGPKTHSDSVFLGALVGMSWVSWAVYVLILGWPKEKGPPVVKQSAESD